MANTDCDGFILARHNLFYDFPRILGGKMSFEKFRYFCERLV